jgi:hypothetical protein
MITKLEGPLRREITIDGRPYVVTISPTGLLLTEKGRRKGFEMQWSAFVSGEVALAKALNASLANAPAPRSGAAAASARPAPRDGDGRQESGRRGGPR